MPLGMGYDTAFPRQKKIGQPDPNGYDAITRGQTPQPAQAVQPPKPAAAPLTAAEAFLNPKKRRMAEQFPLASALDSVRSRYF